MNILKLTILMMEGVFVVFISRVNEAKAPLEKLSLIGPNRSGSVMIKPRSNIEVNGKQTLLQTDLHDESEYISGFFPLIVDFIITIFK